MEMPILLITLSTPLPSAYTVFWTAFSHVTSPRSPCRERSSALSITRYGLTAPAP